MQQLVGSNLALAFFILTRLVNSGQTCTGMLEMPETYFSGTSSESTRKLGTCTLEQLESTCIRQFQHSRHNREGTDASPMVPTQSSLRTRTNNSEIYLMDCETCTNSTPYLMLILAGSTI